ncbi:MAG: extracellular solute-binding protein [bacterium]|nr:extracellular solute-binding protein [bacterium]
MKKLFGVFLVCSVIISMVSGAFATDIKFAHFYDPMGGGAMEDNSNWVHQMFKEFMEANPDITITEEIYQWDQIDTKSIMDLKAKISHDVMMSSPQLMPKHGYINDYMDLSSYVAKWPEDVVKDFSWSPVWFKGIQQGKHIGIPTGTHTRLFAYHKDLFEEAGLDPTKPPTTLDELVDYAKKLTKDKDGDGETDQWGLAMFFGPSRATIELYFAPALWYFGGKLWDPETKEAVFASEEGVKAAQWLYDLIYTHKVTPKYSVTGEYEGNILNDFLDKKVAITWGLGSYWISGLEKGGLVEGVYPATPEGKATKAGVFVIPNVALFTNAWLVSIHALSENPDAAMKFMEHMLQPEKLNVFPDAGLPARLSLWNKPEYQTPFYQTWLEAAKSGRSMPSTGYYGELADTVAAAMQEILASQKPIAETLQKFQDEYNSEYAGE